MTRSMVRALGGRSSASVVHIARVRMAARLRPTVHVTGWPGRARKGIGMTATTGFTAAPQQLRATPAGAAEPRGHLTPRERSALGKAARRALPLEQHACTNGLLSDSTALLQEENRGRLPELVPVRYGRMLTSAFAFFRGSAVVMAEDLAALPNTGLEVQLCGDAHLSNFGVYATPERRLVFDINDFDETLPGPFEWDVKRLATSIALVARANGCDASARAKVVRATVARYRTAMREFAKMGNLAVWYASLDVDRAMADLAPRAKPQEVRRAAKALRRARRRDNVEALHDLTETAGGETRFVHDPPLTVPVDRLFPEADAMLVRRALVEILASYRSTLPENRRHLLDQYQLVDVARRVVGVGSVGTAAYVLLLVGRDGTDPLVLQAKEAGASVLEGRCATSRYDNAGQRVVNGQRLIQAASDMFLGWERTHEGDGEVRDYYLRQLRDGKASAHVDDMDPRHLEVYGQMCAWTLARAHARSGDRIALAAYLGKREKFEHAVTDFAETYAERSEGYYQQLQDAVSRGTVAATTGV
ncbi:MAG: DUF2252 domain-containing protein [Nocardioides sp.]